MFFVFQNFWFDNFVIDNNTFILNTSSWEVHRDHMKVVWQRASTFQATHTLHGYGARPEQPGNMLRDLRLFSYDTYDLPDAESESEIVDILNLPFE